MPLQLHPLLDDAFGLSRDVHEQTIDQILARCLLAYLRRGRAGRAGRFGRLGTFIHPAQRP
jgi:hypothetical protein